MTTIAYSSHDPHTHARSLPLRLFNVGSRLPLTYMQLFISGGKDKRVDKALVHASHDGRPGPGAHLMNIDLLRNLTR